MKCLNKEFFMDITDKLCCAKNSTELCTTENISIYGKDIKVVIMVVGFCNCKPIVFAKYDANQSLYYEINIPFETYRYFMIKDSEALSFIIAHEFGHIMNGDCEPGFIQIIRKICILKTEYAADKFAYETIGYDLCMRALPILSRVGGDRFIAKLRIKRLEYLHKNS